MEDNLFNLLFRDRGEGQKWGARECELTVFNLLSHARKAVSDRDNVVFENVTENVGQLLEIMDRRKSGFACFGLT